MFYYKAITTVFIFVLFFCSSGAYANNINVDNFNELINSAPQSGDTITFTNNLTSYSSISEHFENLNITFEGNNYYINGLNTFGGFIVSRESLFNSVNIINCKGQEYQNSAFAGAIYNTDGTAEITNSRFSGNFVDSHNLDFGVGGAVYNLNNGTMSINSSVFENNYASGAGSYGGAIANGYADTGVENMTIDNSIFENNHAYGTVISYGGAIYNRENIKINNSIFTNNYTDITDGLFGYGGSIFNIGNMEINNTKINGSYVTGANSIAAAGGAIYNEADLYIKNSIINNSYAEDPGGASGGAIYNDIDGTTTIENTLIENNKLITNNGLGGAVGNKGTLIIINSTMKDNYENDSVKNDIYNDNGIIKFEGEGTTNILSGIDGSGSIDKNGSGVLNLGGNNQRYSGSFALNAGTLNLLKDADYFSAGSTVFGNGVNFNMQNGQINNINFGSMTLNGQSNIFPDVNFKTNTMDTISAVSISGGGTIFVPNLNLTGSPAGNFISIPFADNILKDSVKYNQRIIKTPIFDYLSSYNSLNGYFDFSRQGFNSGILVSQIAAQLAGYLVETDTFNNVFSNLDMVMIAQKNKKAALQFLNQSAYTGNSALFSPVLIPEQRGGAWFKPYSILENVPLKNGPTVSNVGYGSLFGAETELRKIKRGWYGLFGGYGMYNGSHQAYDGNGIYNNGGLLGAYGAFYKNNFFSLLTVNAGANSAAANTYFGRENFTMLNTGISQKSGCNLALFNDKLIIQPSIMTSYVFVNTFDYSGSAGVDINTNPLNAIHIEPQIKLIGNFKNFLQPYISVSMVWNIIDKAKFRANDVYLPELSVKPYVRYGAGMQKRWGERLTGFFEAMIRNGGRNGIGFQLGLRISI